MTLPTKLAAWYKDSNVQTQESFRAGRDSTGEVVRDLQAAHHKGAATICPTEKRRRSPRRLLLQTRGSREPSQLRGEGEAGSPCFDLACMNTTVGCAVPSTPLRAGSSQNAKDGAPLFFLVPTKSQKPQPPARRGYLISLKQRLEGSRRREIRKVSLRFVFAMSASGVRKTLTKGG